MQSNTFNFEVVEVKVEPTSSSSYMKGKSQVRSKIIVVGTSAGGLSALVELIEQLPQDFGVPILVVQHISADATGNVLLDALNANGNLKCVHAVNGSIAKAGYVYLAPSDHHLFVEKGGNLLITKGAQENRSRPAIDPLFRSAAVAFGNATIGVLLTGYLDDGTAGLIAIKSCGGTCVVQDPADAAYPDMPKNALSQMEVDYCIPIREMGMLLGELLRKALPKQKKISANMIKEAAIAKRVLSDLPAVNALGDQVPFNCPGCGGVLWQITEGSNLRYRCHTGHSYTAKVLLAEQTKKIEETMWTALRMFEERRNLLSTFASQQTGNTARLSLERANASQVHIDRIRTILKADDKSTDADLPT